MHEREELLPSRSFIPNAVTAANVLAGFASMLLAAKGRYEEAVYLLCASIFLDMMDGRLARMLDATSELGQQLDSLSDAISFGVAPAFLVYQAALHELGVVGLGVSMLYLLAGVFRLARFNLISDAHTKDRRTVGVPIPVGAGYLMVVTLMREHMTPLAAAVVVLAMAALMVSRWRLPNLKGIGLVSAMLLVGLFNYAAIMVWPNWITVGWWNVWNALILMAAKREERDWQFETAEP